MDVVEPALLCFIEDTAQRLDILAFVLIAASTAVAAHDTTVAAGPAAFGADPRVGRDGGVDVLAVAVAEARATEVHAAADPGAL